MLFVGQLFGVMPVIGVLNPDVNGLRFKWLSVRTAFSVLCCTSVSIYAVITVSWTVTTKITLNKVGERSITLNDSSTFVQLFLIFSGMYVLRIKLVGIVDLSGAGQEVAGFN